MTFQRDLAWDYLNQLYRSSISYQLARYALALNFELLPWEVIHQAKRSVLDTLGCAIGAFDAPGRPICETLARQLGGVEEATVFGSGLRTSAANASLVNAFLVRFLDCNDIGGGGHNSDAIPALLAVSEREKVNGREFLTSLVISYELGDRASEASGSKGSVGVNGWAKDIRGGLSMPPALGKLMRMNEEQIANAIGICACHSYPLGILDADQEENSMSKNLRFGWVAYDAVLSCMLAKEGFTGPVRVVEGENGMDQVVMGGNLNRQVLLDFSGWQILKTRHKPLCVNGTSLGHVLATLDIVNEHDLGPDDIASVRIKASPHEAKHTTSLPKKYPRNAESADHSAFYANAIAIKERVLGPETFEPHKFTDPVVLDLIEKITVEADPSLRAFGGASEITTKDGGVLRRRIENAHGFGDDPLADGELEEKFRKLAARHIGEKQIGRIFDAVWNLESLDDIRELTALMVCPIVDGSVKT